MVGLTGERRRGGGGRKAKDKSEITPHKGSKGSINIPLPVSHSNRHHYRDWMMKVVVETYLQEFKYFFLCCIISNLCHRG